MISLICSNGFQTIQSDKKENDLHNFQTMLCLSLISVRGKNEWTTDTKKRSKHQLKLQNKVYESS